MSLGPNQELGITFVPIKTVSHIEGLVSQCPLNIIEEFWSFSQSNIRWSWAFSAFQIVNEELACYINRRLFAIVWLGASKFGFFKLKFTTNSSHRVMCFHHEIIQFVDDSVVHYPIISFRGFKNILASFRSRSMLFCLRSSEQRGEFWLYAVSCLPDERIL